MKLKNKFRLSVALLSVILFSNTIFSQNISSVDRLNDSAKAVLQTKQTSGISEARQLIDKALTLALELNYTQGEIDAYNITAKTYELEGNSRIADRFKKRAEEVQAEKSKQKNPVQSTTDASKPQTIEDFAISTIPINSRTQQPTEEIAATPEKQPTEKSRKVTPVIATKPQAQTSKSTSGNKDEDIKAKLSEIEEKQKLIEELQAQAVQEGGDSISELAELRQAEIARLQAETEAVQSQIIALKKEKENDDLRLKQQQNIVWFLVCIVLMMLAFVFFVTRQIKAKNKANAQLAKTLEELKTTQEQLIQKEKLASLGQLTAGIAHEIQNPLNFVNNFADLSLELLEEIKESNDMDDIKSIADDITQNIAKIYNHGKRADSIVKNMLQHSRERKEDKELTDVNELLKEFSNLAYHGMRATDKNFNCKIVQSLDTSLPKLNLVKQDFGRVFLNMFNNSFYSIAKKIALQSDSYAPELNISTTHKNDKIHIIIEDNGLGMSEEVKQKLFNPFFTTKPTGEGTGLGLSISHDIIVKVHKGEMHVDSTDGKYARFEIILPKD